MSLALAGALQGAGDTKSPTYSSAIGMWLVRVVGVYVLSIYFGMGIVGVWLSIATDLLIRAVFLLSRFNKEVKLNIEARDFELTEDTDGRTVQRIEIGSTAFGE